MEGTYCKLCEYGDFTEDKRKCIYYSENCICLIEDKIQKVDPTFYQPVCGCGRYLYRKVRANVNLNVANNVETKEYEDDPNLCRDRGCETLCGC